MLAAQPKSQLINIEERVPSPLLTAKHLQSMCKDLREEIAKDYEMSARKSIGM